MTTRNVALAVRWNKIKLFFFYYIFSVNVHFISSNKKITVKLHWNGMKTIRNKIQINETAFKTTIISQKYICVSKYAFSNALCRWLWFSKESGIELFLIKMKRKETNYKNNPLYWVWLWSALHKFSYILWQLD